MRDAHWDANDVKLESYQDGPVKSTRAGFAGGREPPGCREHPGKKYFGKPRHRHHMSRDADDCMFTSL